MKREEFCARKRNRNRRVQRKRKLAHRTAGERAKCL